MDDLGGWSAFSINTDEGVIFGKAREDLTLRKSRKTAGKGNPMHAKITYSSVGQGMSYCASGLDLLIWLERQRASVYGAMPTLARVIAVLASIVAGYPAVAEQPVPDAIATYGDWSVFKDDKMCWVATYTDIIETSDKASVNLNPFAFVFFQEGSMQPIISFDLEELVRPGMIAEVGGKTVDLVLEDGTLFTDNDTELLFQMLENDLVVVSDDEHQVTFSLYRLQDAYNHLAKICDFYHSKPDQPTGARLKS